MRRHWQTAEPRWEEVQTMQMLLMTFKTIQELWEFFIRTSLPGLDKGSDQYREMQKAFFSGCAGMLGLQFDATKLPAAEMLKCLSGWTEECSQFLAKAVADSRSFKN